MAMDPCQSFVVVQAAIGHQAEEVGLAVGRLLVGEFESHRASRAGHETVRDAAGPDLGAEALGVFLDYGQFVREIIRVELAGIAANGVSVDFEVADARALRILGADHCLGGI